MLSVNTNLSSLIAQNSLNSSTDALNLAIERMTTGYKINHAKDNAANYAIATQMSSQLSSYEVASNNVAMGMDLVMTADGIINNMQDKASRLHALCIQSRNGTYGAQSLNAINAEVSALVSEIMRVYNTAEYNNISLFDNKAYEIDPSLPQARPSGFIEEPVTTYAMRSASTNNGDFIAEVVEETPDIVVTNPTDLKTAIQNNTKIGIANAETLAQLATLVNDEGITCDGKTIILTEDIDLSAYSNWTPIGNGTNTFEGSFNGNGHIIKNLTINRPTEDNVGLFGYVQGEIKNVGLVGGSVTGQHDTGGLVGNAYGDVTNCYVKVSVNGQGSFTGGLVGNASGDVTNCYSTGNVIGLSACGGLVGGAYGDVTNCYATGSVTGQGEYTGGLVGFLSSNSIINCYATGDVIGQTTTGGLVGNAYGDVTNCYATGNVIGNSDTGGLAGSASTINNSYATGNVTGDVNVGGLVGDANNTITNSYATGSVTGNDFVGGLAGMVSKYSGTISIENCVSYSKVQGNGAIGSSVGGFVNFIIYSPSTTGTLNIVGCEAISQDIDIIGGVYKQETSGPVLQPDYDMSAMLAGVSEVDFHNVTTTLQVGINSESTSQISFDTNFSFDLSALTADITSDEALDCILNFIDTLSSKSTELGAVSNRLESALESISVNIENLTSSRSTIKDADIAQVSSEYIRQQILQQASATLLSTANQSPSIALQLI